MRESVNPLLQHLGLDLDWGSAPACLLQLQLSLNLSISAITEVQPTRDEWAHCIISYLHSTSAVTAEICQTSVPFDSALACSHFKFFPPQSVPLYIFFSLCQKSPERHSHGTCPQINLNPVIMLWIRLLENLWRYVMLGWLFFLELFSMIFSLLCGLFVLWLISLYWFGSHNMLERGGEEG